jgi:hypothetical protein
MSDLGSQPRRVWKWPDRLPAAGRRKAKEFRKHKQVAALTFFVSCLALFFLRICRLFGIRRLVTYLDFLYFECDK